MKYKYSLYVLLMCVGLGSMAPAEAVVRRHRAVKKVTVSELQRNVEQLRSSQFEQAALAERERYALEEKMRMLEVKLTQPDIPRKFTPYSYP